MGSCSTALWTCCETTDDRAGIDFLLPGGQQHPLALDRFPVNATGSDRRAAVTPRTTRLLHLGRRCGACHPNSETPAGRTCCEECSLTCALTHEQLCLSIIAGMISKNWSEPDVFAALLDPANLGGKFLQVLHSRNAGRARTWMQRQYDQTMRWTAEHPAHDVLEDRFVLVQLGDLLGEPALFNRRSASTERAIMRWLIKKGLRVGSLIVRASQREISLDIDAGLQAVNAGLHRLQVLGWLEVYEASSSFKATSYLLKMPDMTGNVITEVPLSMGGKDTPVPLLPAEVPRLFGSQGLGRGVLETFFQLPKVPRLQPSVEDVRAEDWGGLPTSRLVLRHTGRPSGAMWFPQTREAVAAKDLCGPTGFSVETVRRHLQRLKSAGMAVRDNKGLWLGYYTNLATWADVLGVRDGQPARQKRYSNDRRGYFEHLLTPRGYGQSRTRVIKENLNGDDVYFQVLSSGELAEVFRAPSAEQAQSDEASGPSVAS